MGAEMQAGSAEGDRERAEMLEILKQMCLLT